MVVVDPFTPDTAVLTIDGTNVTVQVFNFEESGGNRGFEFVKTMGRRFNKGPRGNKEPYRLSFDATPTDTTFDTLWTAGSSFENPATVVLTTNSNTGSYIITYTGGRIEEMTHNLNADDRIILNMTIVVPPYNEDGADSRVVTSS